jgi:uncharacterized membrane protein
VYQLVIKPLLIKFFASSKPFLLLVIFAILTQIAVAQKTTQKRKQLENERKNLLARIGETKKVIAETKRKGKHQTYSA